MALVDSIEEQHALERLLDDTKPPVPAEAAHLHWLLFTAVPLSAAAGRIAISRSQ
jgi:hypothetical protein